MMLDQVPRITRLEKCRFHGTNSEFAMHTCAIGQNPWWKPSCHIRRNSETLWRPCP